MRTMKAEVNIVSDSSHESVTRKKDTSSQIREWVTVVML